MPQALPLPLLLSKSITKTKKYRTKVAKFGDGYTQRAPDGLNATIDGWSLVWEYLSTTDRDTILAALDAVGGWDYLTWTPNGEVVQKRFVVSEEGYSLRFAGAYTSIACNIVQVYDL